MSDTFTAVDLSQLSAPDVVEELDFETIFSDMLTDLQARDETFDALVESDPAYKILEVAAYRELIIRQRVNDGAHAVMLAYATGTDLDQIAANYNVERLVLDEGDPDAIPPVDPTYESDDDLRRRVQLSPEGYTVAGSQGAYVYHALSADADVKDAQAVSPTPGAVTVYILARDGNGSASVDLVDAVDEYLNAETIRPMTDNVTVQSAAVTEYMVEAVLTVYPGPDDEVIRLSAEDAVKSYVEGLHAIGYDVTLSGLYAALHQSGVQNVSLTKPAADIVIGDGEAAYCTGVSVSIGGTNV
jgi:phage-related baseplate assembly protein